MSKPNSYGSRSNRERRQAVAEQNSLATQVNCGRCNGRHRKGRHYRPVEASPEEKLLTKVFGS